MPVSGKFEADFSAFSAAVADATTQLQAFGKEAVRLSDQLSKVGEEKTLDKFPNEIKKSNEALQALRNTLTDVAAAIGLTFSAQKIVQFVGSIGDAARQLRNLSLETGINTTKLQEYGAVTGDLGVSTEELGKAILNLQNRIAGGDQSAAGAIHALGMSVNDLKQQDPASLFETIVNAVGEIPDQLDRTSTATDLFGQKVGGAVVKVGKGFDDSIAAARRFNKVMSEESVQAAARAADNYDRLVANLQNLAANAIGPSVEGLNNLVDASDKGASKFQIYAAYWKDWFATLISGTPHAEHLADLLDRINRAKPQDIQLPSQKKETAPPSPEDIMAGIRADQLRALTEVQEKYLEQLYDMGRLTAENAKAFGVNAEQMEAFRKKEEDLIAQQTILSDQLRALKGIQTDTFNKAIELTDKLNEKTQKLIDSRNAYLDSLRIQGTLDEQAAAKQNRARALGPGQADPVVTAMENLEKELKRLSDLEAKTGQFYGEQRTQAYSRLDDLLFGNPRGGGPAGIMGALQPPNVTVNVLLDSQPLANAVSKVIMDDNTRKLPNY